MSFTNVGWGQPSASINPIPSQNVSSSSSSPEAAVVQSIVHELAQKLGAAAPDTSIKLTRNITLGGTSFTLNITLSSNGYRTPN